MSVVGLPPLLLLIIVNLPDPGFPVVVEFEYVHLTPGCFPSCP